MEVEVEQHLLQRMQALGGGRDRAGGAQKEAQTVHRLPVGSVGARWGGGTLNGR